MVTSAAGTRQSAILAALVAAAALGCGGGANGGNDGAAAGASSQNGSSSGAGGNPSSAAGGSASTTAAGGSGSSAGGAAGGSGSSAGGGGAGAGGSASSAGGGGAASSSSSNSTASSSSSTGGGGPLRVLFVGNSFTFEDDVPGLVQALAAAKGEPVPLEVGTVASAGETLQQHYESGDMLQALQASSWDVVVLQEHPTMPFDAEATFHQYATLLDGQVKAHGCATMLYVTWVDDAQTAADQDYVTASYVEIAQQLGADVAPVGEAFKNALAAQPSLVLHDSDGFHSNDKGAYLSACVFYAALYSKTPEGAPSPSPSVGADAPFLQSTAWTTWQEGGWTFP